MERKNEKFIIIFTELINLTKLAIDIGIYGENPHIFRLKTFKKTLNSIKEFDFQIKNINDIKNIKWFGEGTIQRINEILQTGKLKEIDELKQKIYKTKTKTQIQIQEQIQKKESKFKLRRKKEKDEILQKNEIGHEIEIHKKNEIVNKLQHIHGIGPVSALKYYDRGVRSIEELKLRADEFKLPKQIIIGLQYYDDFKKKIPRSEIDDIFNIIVSTIHKEIDKNYIIDICGSYRRGKDFSGDIDVLITHPSIKNVNDENNHLQNIVNILKQINVITSSLTSKGEKKFMGVCKHPDLNIYRRIDIRVVPINSYPTALLYFTGSGDFNRDMRSYANHLGYKLSEYKLTDISGKIIYDVNSEKDIFTKLGLSYVPPQNRDKFDKNLF